MIDILPISIEHAEGFREALGSVARERIYLGQIESPSLEWAHEFVANNIKNNHAQFVAVENDTVIGWCDIIPRNLPGFRHSGSIGMGILKEWRHRGLGEALLEACIQKSIANGMTRIELEVYATNTAAIKLYRRLGFVEEGIKRRARFLDGNYEDLLIMAKLSE